AARRRSRAIIALDLTIAVFIAIPVLVPGAGGRGRAADSQEDRPAAFGQEDNEGKTTLGIDSANGRLEFRHGCDGKLTHPEDPSSRPQSSLERRPRGIHLIDLDGHLAFAGGNFPHVEAKEGSLGSVRQFADLDVDRLRCALAIEDQGDLGTHVQTPYAQLKGSWSSMKNGKPLFHYVLQCVSCWKKELPDGDRRQGRRDYTKCPGTRSRGTRAGDRCYPTASKVHRRQLVADARPDSAQKTGCQGHRFPIHRCTVGPRRHFDGRRESLHASTR